MRKIERMSKTPAVPLGSHGLQATAMPIYIYENDQEHFDANGCIKVGRTTLENFINTNVSFYIIFIEILPKIVGWVV